MNHNADERTIVLHFIAQCVTSGSCPPARQFLFNISFQRNAETTQGPARALQCNAHSKNPTCTRRVHPDSAHNLFAKPRPNSLATASRWAHPIAAMPACPRIVSGLACLGAVWKWICKPFGNIFWLPFCGRYLALVLIHFGSDRGF